MNGVLVDQEGGCLKDRIPVQLQPFNAFLFLFKNLANFNILPITKLVFRTTGKCSAEHEVGLETEN